MKQSFIICVLMLQISAMAQTGPEVTSWIINTTGARGYAGIPSNVQLVQYSTSNVYVSASCIPSYNIGPWKGNPNIPVNQNFVYKITRSPRQNTGTPTVVGLGHVGVWTNGVSIFNASDGQSYNNQGVWNRNAYYWEGPSFDDCLGHPAPGGEYHHHVSPACLYDEYDSTHHSPIIGFAFDGYPVYGGYAYENADGTGPIVRIRSSYTIATAASRTNGPAVSPTYPAGCFMEDYVYTEGSGHCDQRNGRFCITPEYPSGTYAYFATIDAPLKPSFPYTLYRNYYGLVQPGNTGPGGGHNTITEQVIRYDPAASSVAGDAVPEFMVFPNPANDVLGLFVESTNNNNLYCNLYNNLGECVYAQQYIQPMISYSIDLSNLVTGTYTLVMHADSTHQQQSIVIMR